MCSDVEELTYNWYVPIGGTPNIWMYVGSGQTIPTYTTVPTYGINSRYYRVDINDGTNTYTGYRYTSVYCTFLDPVGGPEVEKTETPILETTQTLKIYPNPANDKIQLDLTILDNKPNLELSIYDISGKFILTIFKGEIERGSYIFEQNIASLPNGMYIINTIGAGINSQQKLIINR